MPKLFLSPAQHHKKPCLYDAACSEATHCNILADYIEPHLKACGIDYLRNIKGDESTSSIVKQSNAYGPDLHMTIHTNGAGGRRCTFYYYPGSAQSKHLADLCVKYYVNEAGYPYPCKSAPQSSWAELKSTRAPAVYGEIVFHDNKDDATWLHNHYEDVARALTMAACEYLQLQYIAPGQSPAPIGNVTVEEIARVVAAECRGEIYQGQIALTQCIHDRWQDEKKRFGKDLAAVMAPGQFARPWAGDLSTTTCEAAVHAVFRQGQRAYSQPCLWVLGKSAGQSTVYARNSKYVFLGKIGNQQFWGDEKADLYTVIRGDTLYSIARRYGTTAAELVRLNGIADPDVIYAGDVIRLPK